MKAQTDSVLTNIALDSVEIRTTTPDFLKKTVAAPHFIEKTPAAFEDPMRVLAQTTGVVSDNDGANQISVRGLSPNMMTYWLEGAEILNPNHLPNAGTASDRATLNGGGVLALPFGALQATVLTRGVQSTDKIGSLHSNIDFSLREGDAADHKKNAFSSSLVGISAMRAGNFGKNNSYLVGYRYGTVGLLSALGVPLGDEKVVFQDAVFNLSFRKKMAKNRSMNTRIFGFWGGSSNSFQNKPLADRITEKDSRNIDFKNKTSSIAAKSSIFFNKNTSLEGILSYSERISDRKDVQTNEKSTPLSTNTENGDFNLLFFKMALKSSFKNIQYQVGILSKKNENTYVFGENDSLLERSVLKKISYTSSSIFGEIGQNIYKHFSWKIGVRGISYFLSDTDNQPSSIEPRLEINYNNFLTKNDKISFQAANQGQIVETFVGLQNKSIENTIRQKLINAQSMQLSYSLYNPKIYVTLTTFYQQFSQNYGISLNRPSFADAYSIEALPSDLRVPLPIGSVQTQGIEAEAASNSSSSFFWRCNASFYDAVVKNEDKTVSRPTRYNGRYATNITLGKTFYFDKKPTKKRALTVTLHNILRGGFRETEIDVAKSSLSNTTVYHYEKIYQDRLSDYYRADLGIQLKTTKINRTHIWFLDIQNLTNHQNVQFRYFDTFTQKITTKYQLGLIPNLGWRIVF